jgi:hypothetical protein
VRLERFAGGVNQGVIIPSGRSFLLSLNLR